VAVTSLVLVAATLAGCAGCTADGADGGGRDSSVAEFCGALGTFRDRVAAADSTDLVAYIRALKDAARAVQEVGVPDEMPGEAEQGFDLTMQRILDLADDASQADVAALGDVEPEQQRTLDALEDYIKDACPELSEPS
jgi:hypothetical protein